MVRVDVGAVLIHKMLLRILSIVMMVMATLPASAVPTVKSPLDVPAPIDSRATSTRLVGIKAIGKATDAFAAVGPWGKIITTHDAGKTWIQSPAPVSSDLVAVDFPTPKQGWAVGHDGIVLHSADGGKTWEHQLDGRQYGDLMAAYYEKLAQSGDPRMVRALEDARHFKSDGADKPFLDVWFENEHSGWVVGAFNLILKTDDGGKTWEPWIDRTENANAYTLFAIGNAGDEVFIVGELGLIQHLDREKGRFVLVKTPYPGSFFGLTGKPGVVVIYGLRGNAFRSHDSGKTWQQLDTRTASGITDGIFLDDGRLVLVNSDGQITVSNNDGDSFSNAALNMPMQLNGVVQIAGDRLIVVGERGVSIESAKQQPAGNPK